MNPIEVSVRVPRGVEGMELHAAWRAGPVTFVVGPDGLRRDALLLLLACALELPHRLEEANPLWLRVAPVTVATHTADQMLGRAMTAPLTWRNPACVRWGPTSLRLWGIGCDHHPSDDPTRGVLCAPSGALYLGAWDRLLVGKVSPSLLLAPSVESWAPEARVTVDRAIKHGTRVILSGRQVPSWVRSIPDLREVLVPSSSRQAVVR